MKADDLVDLVFITPHNHLCGAAVTRQFASDQIRTWFHARDEFSKWSWASRVWYHLRYWLAPNTLALNYEDGEKEGVSYAHWAIGWESILGMYVRERQATHQEKIAKAAEKMADVLEKEANKGEEWK